MTTDRMTASDAELVAESLGGSREAFGGIVERYQSLVCSLAYNATGNLTQSEDLAQETFVLAWKELRQLREPKKLRPWLCRIARSVISRSWRRERREPATAGASVEILADQAACEPLPSERAVNREEEAILWRSLQGIPETYREPLILYYREGQSVERVAEQLELSEDAVKQRLSRGRKLLQEQVMGFVEGTLRRSGPGKAFTLGVMAALPGWVASTSAASVGAVAAKSSGAAKAAVSAGLAGAVFGPLLGLLGGLAGTKASIENTESQRERQFMVQMAKRTWALVGVFCVAIFALTWAARAWWKTHPLLIGTGFICVTVGYVVTLLALILRSNRAQQQIRAEEAAKGPSGTMPPGRPEFFTAFNVARREYRSRWTLLGLPLIHVRTGFQENGRTLPAKGWLAIGDVAYGGLLGFGARLAVAPISLGGGMAVGVVALGGGCAGGLLAVGGGLSLGGCALGGLALGFLAEGGCAAGWRAAEGGVAMARDYALGGLAYADQANTAAAQAFIHSSPFYATAEMIIRAFRSPGWAAAISVFLVGLWLMQRARAKRIKSSR